MIYPNKTRIKVIDDFWESNETDKEVEAPPPEKLIQKVKKGFCNVRLDPIKVRLIKYTINDQAYVLLTTLRDREKYPEGCFKEVYHSRWGHEEMLKVSKVITGVTDFHSKTKRGIEQELFAHFVIITLLKIIESQTHHQIEKKMSDKKVVLKKLRRLKISGTEKASKQSTLKSVVEKKEVQMNQKAIF